ncbi:MAG: YhgE/Pip domain-containing protein [Streptococcaceae bacterium]|nr:YhgE/Pip domain-containing protein [Streptococcaceae bacterium]
MRLKNIFTLQKLEFKRIFKNPIAVGLFTALLILPSLYAWFNIKALWDPYSQTGNLPVAVYSDDQNANFKSKTVNVGDDLLKELHKNHSLGWTFVSSKAELDNGVKSGKYYAGIYIPKDFSKDILSFTDGKIIKPELEYSVNEKINAIAPKITDKGATTLQETISQEFSKEVSGTLMGVFNEIGFDLATNLPHLQQLKSAILKMDANMGEYNGYMNNILELNQKMPEFQAKLDKANEFSAYLPEANHLANKLVALNNKMPELTKQAAVILTIQQKLPEINQAANQLKMINDDNFC